MAGVVNGSGSILATRAWIEKNDPAAMNSAEAHTPQVPREPGAASQRTRPHHTNVAGGGDRHDRPDEEQHEKRDAVEHAAGTRERLEPLVHRAQSEHDGHDQPTDIHPARPRGDGTNGGQRGDDEVSRHEAVCHGPQGGRCDPHGEHRTDEQLPASPMQRGAFPSQERNRAENHGQSTGDDVYL